MSKDDKKKEPTDIVKHEPTNLVDNFEGWEDGVEGDDRPQGAGIIQGTLIKFTNEYTWVTRDGEELPENLELCPVDVLRVVQKWQDQQPIETIILEPHQKFPDIKKMNEEAPKEEWVEGPDDKMHGPYQAQHGRQRPHFKILPNRWVRLGGEGDQIEPASGLTPLPPPTTATPDKPIEPATVQSELPLETVKEPSLKEELNDDLPDDLRDPNEKAQSQKASPPRSTARRELKKAPAKAIRSPSRKRQTIIDAG